MNIKVNAPKVEMKRKKEICVKLSQQSFSEEEMRKIIEKLENENMEIRAKYYSRNTPIYETSQRNFLELVKKFFSISKEGIFARVNNAKI